jgi:hypothetical protein
MLAAKPLPKFFVPPVVLVILALGIVAAWPREFTQHALESHSEQTWNAVSIWNYFLDDRCYPQIVPCMDREIWVCPDPYNSKRLLGLVVSSEGRIITGFTAPRSYWEKVFQKCLDPKH